jgi:signal transduction histidine kinase
LTEGAVPPEFASLGPALDSIGQAKLGWDKSDENTPFLSARMKRVETPAGNVQIIATTDTRASDAKSLLRIGLTFFAITLPGLAVMTLATLFATPRVVRNALIGLDEAAQQARKIDIDKQGTRLPSDAVPLEVAPLVDAVNDALARLDEGYERHRRFLADAAHELRTPIAILTTRLESLPGSADKNRLIEDAARLGTLTEQLLDVQRFQRNLVQPSRIDLGTLCSRVIADLAPMAIAAGYDISLQKEVEHVEVWGDESSLERVLINIVQNAIQHGGRRGEIVVALKAPAVVEVKDDGPGVPAAQREQVFEAFHRAGPHSRGAGLGLHLVQEIMRLHDGEVSVVDTDSKGACFRVTLPPLPTRSMAAE